MNKILWGIIIILMLFALWKASYNIYFQLTNECIQWHEEYWLDYIIVAGKTPLFQYWNIQVCDKYIKK